MPLRSGDKYKNYLVTKVLSIDEIGCTLLECTHQPTGASIIKLLNGDDENLFSLSFKTWPTKSDGVAHILEHTLLCGSEKFPIKDPFFSMTRRSLNTYMNALTGGDFTCYPAATLIPEDFYNLLSVYLDAVFHPTLNPLSFMQEGHRLEFTEKKDASSPLQFKGIVFNEMKGALGSKEARLSEEIMHTLYPDTTYGVNSGGDPKVITELTYTQLKEFHQTYYHPSQCYFFFYGNLPLEEQLDYLEEHAFKGVEKQKALPQLAPQKRFSEKRTFIKYYPDTASEENEEKVLLSISYLTCSILEQEELLALNVLDILLMGTDGSPLKKALLKSNLCKQAEGTLDNEMNDVPYIITCKGCREGAAQAIEKVIDESLSKVIKEGFSEEMIEGAIHQLEMARSEITGGSSPYGLSLFFRSILLKQHGGHVEDGLMIHSLFAQLRKRKKESYLALIQKHFLDNTHKVLLEMRPDLTLAKKEEEEEIAKLKVIQEKLSEKDKKGIISQSVRLATFQKKKESSSLECLPKVTLHDVKREGKEFPLVESNYGPLTLYTHSCFTNKLLYTDFIFPLPAFTLAEMPYVRLFCNLLPQVGAAGRSYSENLDFMLKHTGGITAFFDLGQHVHDPNQMHPFFCLRGKALDRKANKLFELMHDTLTSADFTDKERLQELLIQHLNSLESNIQRSPLRYGINLAASSFSKPSTIANQCYGLPYYWLMKKVLAEFKKEPALLIEKLQRFKERILCFEKADMVISADEKMIAHIEQNQLFGLHNLCQKSVPLWQAKEYISTTLPSHAREIATPVSFSTLLFPTINYKHREAASLSIGSEIMENLVLHPLIREQGGAYGSGAVFNALGGQFYFYTYRDPHLSASVVACNKAIDLLCKKKFTEDDLEEAKLQLFQDLDAPLPPYARAFTTYARMRSGRTPEIRQAYRERLFAADSHAIQKSAKEYLKEPMKKAILITFAGKELLEKECALLTPPLTYYSIEEENV